MLNCDKDMIVNGNIEYKHMLAFMKAILLTKLHAYYQASDTIGISR